MQSLVDLLLRAAYLVALAIAPPFFSPAPALHGTVVLGVSAALLLVAFVVAAGILRVRLGGREGLAVALLLGAAVAAALVGADVFRDDRAPLGRGLLYVAVPLWIGLAVLVGALVSRRYGATSPRARVVGIALMVGVAGALFASSAGWLFSRDRMWFAALRVDGDNAPAVEALTRASMRARKYDDVLVLLDRCTTVNPEACACLAARAEVGLRLHAAAPAIAEARAVRDRCPSSAAARATLAEGLAIYGDPEQAEQEARAALEKGDDGPTRYALALALDRIGRHGEAIDEAKHAAALGAGRDASLLVGSLAISAGDLDTAVSALTPIVAADPEDAAAQYDLALVADRRNDYNTARQGYLAALRADPHLAGARYNLALLTLRQGAVDEARHHAERFMAAFPSDPRGPSLLQQIASASRR